jgi:WD40 repeat protein
MQGHLLPVANLALHPSKPILATASDDKTWKLWHLPAGDLIMCGEGHRCAALGKTPCTWQHGDGVLAQYSAYSLLAHTPRGC